MKKLIPLTLMLLSGVFLMIGCNDSEIVNNDEAFINDKNNINNSAFTIITAEMIGLAHYGGLVQADQYLRDIYDADPANFWKEYELYTDNSDEIAGTYLTSMIEGMKLDEYLEKYDQIPVPTGDLRQNILNTIDTLYYENKYNYSSYINTKELYETIFEVMDLEGFYSVKTYLTNKYDPIKNINIVNNDMGDYYAALGFVYYSFLGVGTYMNEFGKDQGQFGTEPSTIAAVDWDKVHEKDGEAFFDAIRDERIPGDPAHKDGVLGYAVGCGLVASHKEYKRQKKAEEAAQ